MASASPSASPPSSGGSSSVVAWLALLAAAAALGVGLHASKGSRPDGDSESEADLLNAKSLENRLADVEKRLETIQERANILEERASRAEKETASAMAIVRANIRIDSTGAGADAGKGAAGAVTDEESKKADEEAKKVEAERILAVIRGGEIPEGGVFGLFQRMRDLGYLDKALAEMEKYAEAHADNADVQVQLGGAYIVKLMAVPDGMERGAWSSKSLAACESALKIQPEHWDAQYLKGMNLSQWPAFLGRQPDAIKTFEKLIEQQERGAPVAKFAGTYYQLGNTYRLAGNTDKARKVFARGLEIFPEDKQLKDQIELLDKK